MSVFNSHAIERIHKGEVGVIPTDTLYGLVGRADIKEVVERIYAIRERNVNKPCIILVSSLDDVKKFNVTIPPEIIEVLKTKNIWPGKVSIVFPSHDPSFDYLSRGTHSLSFRLPDSPELQRVIAETGPLIAPSANPEGKKPAATIEAAKSYFGDKVDFYVDGGVLDGLPSTLITFEGTSVVVLREGAAPV